MLARLLLHLFNYAPGKETRAVVVNCQFEFVFDGWVVFVVSRVLRAHDQTLADELVVFPAVSDAKLRLVTV